MALMIASSVVRSLVRTGAGLCAAVLVAMPHRAAAQEVGLPVGTRAPAAAVETLDGKPADLGAIAGRGPALIEFWATWCPNCKALEPQIHDLAARYAGRLRLVGVAVSVNQSPERVRAYAAKYKLPLELYYDRGGKATAAYDVPATSYIVVLDRMGKVVYTGQGAEQKLEQAVRSVVR